MTLQLRSIMQCPHCGFKVTERMPVNMRVLRWQCPACTAMAEPAVGACCVFCCYGSQPCPQVQQQQQQHSQ
ncbi:MAG TPA: GDCCVxC domain-containing (seleno)protein [Pseudomonadales bacterium]